MLVMTCGARLSRGRLNGVESRLQWNGGRGEPGQRLLLRVCQMVCCAEPRQAWWGLDNTIKPSCPAARKAQLLTAAADAGCPPPPTSQSWRLLCN